MKNEPMRPGDVFALLLLMITLVAGLSFAAKGCAKGSEPTPKPSISTQ